MNVVDEIAADLDWQDAIGRSIVYTFLSRALAYPDPVQLGVARERILPALLELELEGPLGDAIRGGVARLHGPLDSLRLVHTQIFSLTVSSDCPDYETAYLSRDVFQQGHVMADIAGFYRAHGLEVGGQSYQRPDHITIELEFMGFLARKEAYAIEHLGEEQRAMAREAQATFLRDHLACWGPALGRRIAACDGPGDSPYRWLGQALAAWIADECAYLAVTPASSVDRPMLEWPEPDDGMCGIESDCPVVGSGSPGIR